MSYVELMGFGPTGWGLAMLAAAGVTLAVALCAFLIGGVVGVLGAWAKLSDSTAARLCADAYTTVLRGVPDLLAGRTDAIFGSMSALRATFKNPDFADFKMAGAQFSGGVFGRGAGVGLRKSDPELKRMFDDAIAAAIAEGAMQKLSLKWFKADLTPRD